MTKRYKELIKENNLRVSTLQNEYLELANIYIKKARGFAVKSEDTEVKIRNTIAKIEAYQKDNIEIDKNEFINEEMKTLSKQVKDYEMIKGAIIFAVMVLVGAIWGGISCYMNQKGSFAAPSNIRVTDVIPVNETKANIVLTWDGNEFAESYSIYYSKEGYNSAISTTTTNTITIQIEYDVDYIFYLYINETDYINKSDTITFTYKLEK